MLRRFLQALVFLLLLIPSAQFAWRNRDMPEFASLHDDGIFFVSGQSIANGHGYRIASLPEKPLQTKVPPLFPYWLSLVWWVNPHFPENLELATTLSWLALVACLGLVWNFFRADGASESRSWMLTAMLALSPHMILFGATIFSEIPFTCLLLITLLLARRPGNGPIIIAGLVAACAYLCRTAGIALLLAVPGVLLLKKDWRRAGLFAAAMLPAIAGWSLWTAAHRLASADLTLIYYADYIKYQFINVGFDNFAVVLWKNADQILYGMGSLVLPKLADSLPLKILTQVIGVAMISGIVRMVRRNMSLDYALFALGSIAILLVWHFPPTERFVLPLYPLFLAGLITELEHLWSMLKPAFRHKDVGQRVVGGLFGAGVAALMMACLGIQVYMDFFFLNETAAGQRIRLADRKAAYQWMALHLPTSAAVLSYDDPLLYLYTGHQGNYLPLLPRWWYADDHKKMIGAYSDVPAYCRSRGLSYIYFTTDDLSRETGEEDRKAIEKLIRHNPALEVVYSEGIGTVYKVNPEVLTQIPGGPPHNAPVVQNPVVQPPIVQTRVF